MPRSEGLDNCRGLFHDDRDTYASKFNLVKGMLASPFIRDQRGWIVFGPQDVRCGVRKWHFSLQCRKLTNREAKRPDLHIRVRVGCRYYTLKSAWKHWGAKPRPMYYGGSTQRRNERAQAVAIIRLMLLQAQAYGLLSMYAPLPKFDNTILKPRRQK